MAESTKTMVDRAECPLAVQSTPMRFLRIFPELAPILARHFGFTKEAKK